MVAEVVKLIQRLIYNHSDKNISDDDLKEMEHIRWARYHIYYGWSYAEGKKDKVKKTHPDLVKFEKLKKGERQKDSIFNSRIKKLIEKNL